MPATKYPMPLAYKTEKFPGYHLHWVGKHIFNWIFHVY